MLHVGNYLLSVSPKLCFTHGVARCTMSKSGIIVRLARHEDYQGVINLSGGNN